MQQSSGERAGLTAAGPDRCAFLRWKGMYIDAVWDPTVQHANDRAFWCQHTFTCLGPDNKVVDDFECNPARGCYTQL